MVALNKYGIQESATSYMGNTGETPIKYFKDQNGKIEPHPDASDDEELSSHLLSKLLRRFNIPPSEFDLNDDFLRDPN